MYTATLKYKREVVATKEYNSYKDATKFERDAPYEYGIVSGLKGDWKNISISIIKIINYGA